MQKYFTLFISILAFMNIHEAHAQEAPWKTKNYKDGVTTIRYRISDQNMDYQSKEIRVEYEAKTIAKTSFDACIAVMDSVPTHAYIINERQSRILKRINDTEQAIYYYMDPPWPLEDSECIASMKCTYSEGHKVATYRIQAAPDLWKPSNLKRFTAFEMIYQFVDLGNGKVEITHAAKITPVIKVPKWAVSTSFPTVPAGILRRLIELSNSI